MNCRLYFLWRVLYVIFIPRHSVHNSMVVDVEGQEKSGLLRRLRSTTGRVRIIVILHVIPPPITTPFMISFVCVPQVQQIVQRKRADKSAASLSEDWVSHSKHSLRQLQPMFPSKQRLFLFESLLFIYFFNSYGYVFHSKIHQTTQRTVSIFYIYSRLCGISQYVGVRIH